MPGAAFNRGGSKQDYSTPDDFMAAVQKRFGAIVFDLAADTTNAKAPLFFTEATDALAQDWWSGGGWLWLNPPFDRIEPWAKKCAEEARDGAHILFLVPAAVGSNWWRDFVHQEAHVFFLNGRLSFDGKNPYPKDCALCVYSQRAGTGYDVWAWRMELEPQTQLPLAKARGRAKVLR